MVRASSLNHGDPLEFPKMQFHGAWIPLHPTSILCGVSTALSDCGLNSRVGFVCSYKALSIPQSTNDLLSERSQCFGKLLAASVTWGCLGTWGTSQLPAGQACHWFLATSHGKTSFLLTFPTYPETRSLMTPALLSGLWDFCSG